MNSHVIGEKSIGSVELMLKQCWVKNLKILYLKSNFPTIQLANKKNGINENKK